MKQELTITNVEKKVSKTNQQYLSITTDLGKFGCWNASIFGQLQQGHRYEVTAENNNGYNNILGIEKDLGAVSYTASPSAPQGTDYKSSTMRESYAKDILLKMLETTKDANPQPDIFVMAEAAATCVLKIKDTIAKNQG